MVYILYTYIVDIEHQYLSIVQQEGGGSSRTAGGTRKQRAAGKLHRRAAWIGTGREVGGSEDGGGEITQQV